MAIQDLIPTDKIYARMDDIDKLGVERMEAKYPKQIGAIVAAARKNPVIFNDFCFQDESGKYWRSGKIHHEWQRLFPVSGSGVYVVILAPRDHAKTSQVVLGRPLFELGNDPTLRIKIVCNTDPKARKRVQELQQHIESNSRLHLVFPHLQPDKALGWEKHKFFIQRDMISREPTIEAYGILSGATGDRADMLIFDDVVDMKNSVLQPKSREAVKESFRSVWLNLLGTGGVAIYIATPWHLDDLSNEIINNPEWRLWKKPAIDEDGNALWPERWPIEALEDRRNKIGQAAFQQQFMLEALSTEEATFSSQSIDNCIRPIHMGEWQRGTSIPREWPVFMGIDPGASMGQRSSPTAIMIIAVSPDGTRYPLYAFQSKVKFPELIEITTTLNDTYKPSLILGENNSFQEAFLQQMASERRDIPIKGHYTGSKKWDTYDGLPGLSAVMANGGWVIPKPCSCDKIPCRCHSPSCQCISCEWERELRYHPKWKSSDIVMAQWLCEVAAREGTRSRDRSFIDLGSIWTEYDREKGERR